MSAENVENADNVYGYIISNLDLINEIGNSVDNTVKNKDMNKLIELAKEQLKRLNIKNEIIEKINIEKILYDYFYVGFENTQNTLNIISDMPEKLISWANEIKTNINIGETNIDLYKYLDEITIDIHFYFTKDKNNGNKYMLKYASIVFMDKDGNNKADITIYLDNNLKMIGTIENYLRILELAYRLIP